MGFCYRILDNLPAAVHYYDELKQGFPLGYIGDDGVPYLFNHIEFNIDYNDAEGPPNTARIVGFEVVPYSVAHAKKGDKLDLLCSEEEPVVRSLKPAVRAMCTYIALNVWFIDFSVRLLISQGPLFSHMM